MPLSYKDIAKLIDISCVLTHNTHEDIELLAASAKKYNFICAFSLPYYTQKLKSLLAGSSVLVGGVSGFPSGAVTTEQKISDAKLMKSFGCDEVDMVINQGALKAGDDSYIQREINAVVDVLAPLPVKLILETAYLTDEEIVRACTLALDTGLTFIKTGTGWASSPTTMENVRLIKKTVGDKLRIKAAGGIRSLQLLEAMYDAGCSRFGISLQSAIAILKEAYQRDGVAFDDVF